MFEVALGLVCCGPLDADFSGQTRVDGLGCATPGVEIARVQGAFAASPLADQLTEVRGGVTLAEPGVGFYVQSESADPDPQTSEGLFVRAELASPSTGERVFLRGRVREQAGSTELHAVDLIQSCGRAQLRPAEAVFDASSGLERWEHMWVTSRDTWTLVDASDLARGELTASRAGRLYAPGHELGPREEHAENQLWRLHMAGETSAGSARRLGSTAEVLTGIVQLAPSGPGLLVTAPPGWQEPRVPEPPPPEPESLRVASLNLHNYFAEPGRRGAADELELERQRSKLVAALSALDADILALVEVGNSAASIEHLAAGVNARRAPDERFLWSSVEPPATSAIRAVLLYRADRVQVAGDAWFELEPTFTRPPLFQRFLRSSIELTVGVVHLKSKRCDGEVPLRELEGCGAAERAAEAGALARVSALLERGGAARLLLIGDFNADAREAPLLTLKQAGWIDLLDAVPAHDRYSYVFDARATLLDHALANAALARDALEASIWHINADEPAARGYSCDNPPCDYAPDARRSSDHDPISVDLRL